MHGRTTLWLLCGILIPANSPFIIYRVQEKSCGIHSAVKYEGNDDGSSGTDAVSEATVIITFWEYSDNKLSACTNAFVCTAHFMNRAGLEKYSHFLLLTKKDWRKH